MGRKRGREDEEEKIRKKIKKLQNKLSRKRRRIISSSEEDDYNNDVEHARSPTPVRAPPSPPPLPLPPTPEPQPGPSTAPDDALPASSTQPSQPEVSTDPAEVTVSDETPALDEDILLLLGEAPEPETLLGKPIHNDVASRWQEILKKGLSKETKEKIQKEYLVPSNVELLVPPILNPEAKAALTEQLVKRDGSLTYRQKQTSVSLSALGVAVDTIISKKEIPTSFKQEVLKPVSDACRILCDMHHTETVTRRKFVISSINSTLKDTLIGSTADKYLFGDNMADKLKAAKTVQRSGEALKVAPKPTFNKNNFTRKGFANKNASNFKPLHQKTAGRQDAERPHPPAAPRAAPRSTVRRPPPPPSRDAGRRYSRR